MAERQLPRLGLLLKTVAVSKIRGIASQYSIFALHCVVIPLYTLGDSSISPGPLNDFARSYYLKY
jgi:hypothetical protein